MPIDPHTFFPDDGRFWRAFYTRPRHEKKAAGRLEAEFEVYCPVRETRVQWSDRWKTVQKPLFTGYIFARVNDEERRRLLEDPSVSRTVTWLGKPAHIRDEEIYAIRVLLEEAEEVEVTYVSEGDRVRVDSGELRDMHGVVVSVSGKRARLRIESMQCELTFSVRASQLQKL